MGATVSCSKQVGGYETAQGVIYVLFEETYEKNVYPHTPRWDAVAFGSYEEVMKWVMVAASVCEGGLLRSRSGPTTPEAYLAAWQKAFQCATRMRNREIALHARGWWAPIDKDNIPAAKTALVEIGRSDIADALSSEQDVKISLYEDTEVLRALYAYGRSSISRAIAHRDGCEGEYLPTPVRSNAIAVVHPITAFKIGPYERAVAYGDAPLRLAGWDYSVVGDFVVHQGYAMEMASTGSSRAAIRHVREVVKAAPLLPDDAWITVAPRESKESYSYRYLASQLGLMSDGGLPESIRVQYCDFLQGGDDQLVWHLAQCGDLVSIDVSMCQAQGPVKKTQSPYSPAQQVELFA